MSEKIIQLIGVDCTNAYQSGEVDNCIFEVVYGNSDTKEEAVAWLQTALESETENKY